MTIYYLLLIIFFIAFLFEVLISYKSVLLLKLIMAILGITIICIAGLRWDTGTDWENYLYYFRIINTRPLGETGMEFGYELIVRFFRFFISSEYTHFLFFFSFLIISTTYYAVYKLSPYPLFSLFLLLTYSLVGSGFGVRQDLAICLTLLSTIFIIERNLLRFLIFVCLAALIHNSALIFIPAYWIFEFRWSKYSVVFMLIALIIIAVLSKFIIGYFGSIVSDYKTNLYLEMSVESADPIRALIKGLINRSVILLIVIPFLFKSPIHKESYYGLVNLYIIGVIIFMIVTPINPIFNRLARFYEIYQIILLPMAYFYSSRYSKLIILFVLVSISIIKFNTVIQNDVDLVYVPYKSVL